MNNGHVETAKVLISRGADVNAREIAGGTPLHGATQSLFIPSIERRQELIELLMHANADPRIRDKVGIGPADNAHVQRVKRAMEHRAADRFRGRDMCTHLMSTVPEHKEGPYAGAHGPPTSDAVCRFPAEKEASECAAQGCSMPVVDAPLVRVAHGNGESTGNGNGEGFTSDGTSHVVGSSDAGAVSAAEKSASTGKHAADVVAENSGPESDVAGGGIALWLDGVNRLLVRAERPREQSDSGRGKELSDRSKPAQSPPADGPTVACSGDPPPTATTSAPAAAHGAREAAPHEAEGLLSSLGQQLTLQALRLFHPHAPKLEAAQAPDLARAWEELLPRLTAHPAAMRADPRVVELWRQGIPAKLRGRVWALAIGNVHGVSAETYRRMLALARSLEASDGEMTGPDRRLDRKSAASRSRARQRAAREQANGQGGGVGAGGSIAPASDASGAGRGGQLAPVHCTKLPREPSRAPGAEESSHAAGAGGAVGREEEGWIGREDEPWIDRATLRQVDLDLDRTFPELGFFHRDGPYHALLRDLLLACAAFRPSIGYVQGMGYIASTFLLYMDPPEAFVCLANLLSQHHFPEFLLIDMDGINRHAAAFDAHLAQHLPQLARHLKKVQVDTRLYILEWWMTVFGTVLPVEASGVAWDLVLLDGVAALVRLTLGLLHVLQDQLLDHSFEHCLTCLTHVELWFSPHNSAPAADDPAADAAEDGQDGGGAGQASSGERARAAEPAGGWRSFSAVLAFGQSLELDAELLRTQEDDQAGPSGGKEDSTDGDSGMRRFIHSLAMLAQQDQAAAQARRERLHARLLERGANIWQSATGWPHAPQAQAQAGAGVEPAAGAAVSAGTAAGAAVSAGTAAGAAVSAGTAAGGADGGDAAGADAAAAVATTAAEPGAPSEEAGLGAADRDTGGLDPILLSIQQQLTLQFGGGAGGKGGFLGLWSSALGGDAGGDQKAQVGEEQPAAAPSGEAAGEPRSRGESLVEAGGGAQAGPALVVARPDFAIKGGTENGEGDRAVDPWVVVESYGGEDDDEVEA